MDSHSPLVLVMTWFVFELTSETLQKKKVLAQILLPTATIFKPQAMNELLYLSRDQNLHSPTHPAKT